ncbi:alpha-beta hydrolase superfamily lysophospholipase [Microbacterium endophyticum]|uniref:Alpha-beta hydrolase superfamily lysophospholipase n=1 Tax=Microbacterium endophyticum TaxID=1526412 RepID=A0A7W4YN95_9MICO|nr:alpha/beta fold hydrolase [Microbacterium endophyticum]MBB2976988.1 alpha-beta hydrolase superfamily lysophospholipase [Microbacterium endophyticum]NIK36726.1 alpha-beta hydrolase superfamily lysophospholipase [Microbacterium endophyticum]
MMPSRRAGSRNASPALKAGLKTALVVLSGAFAVVMGALGVVSAHVARLVVTPAARRADLKVLTLDTSAQTITLSRTLDTSLPGRYGLFTVGTEQYVKIGTVLAEDEKTVTRKLLTHIGPHSRLAPDAAFSGWYFDRPEQLHLPYVSELIGSAVGPCPAWLFPAQEPSDTWCIQVHGRGTTRAECLRAVPLFHSLGINTLVVSYRNDGEAPRSRTGTYALGATEWRDVDAAVGFARRRGAQRIILMGWSMGGAIALQLALSSAHRDRIAGIILDSPVIDWRVVLDYQAAQLGLPRVVRDLAIQTLSSEWGTMITRTGAPIPFDRLDVVSRADHLQHPILILHSDDDGFVPSDASHDLATARPDLVEMNVFDTARHTKLWNYDSQRWERTIRAWIQERDVIQPRADEGN